MNLETYRLLDKKYLSSLAKTLDVSVSNLHKDELGDWCLYGIRKENWIYTDGEYGYLTVRSESSRSWNSVKNKFSGFEVWIDGDSEGVLRWKDLSDDSVAKALKKFLKLRTTHVSEKQVEGLRKFNGKYETREP